MDETKTNRVAIWATVAVVLVVIAGSAGAGLWLRSQPEPLTGDYYADRACAAAMTNLIDEQGRPTAGKFMMMDDATQREWVSGIVEQSQYSELPEIKSAGEQLAFSTRADGSSMLGIASFARAFGAFADACTSNGWTACAAGLITEGCVATPPR